MARTHQEFVDALLAKNDTIKVIGTYTKAQNRIAVKCKECDHEWAPLAYSLLQGRSCPKCGAKRKVTSNKGKTGLKTHQMFVNEMAAAHPDIKVEGRYINGHTSIQLTCLTCSHEWKAQPYSLLQGHGCPRCAKSGTSFMEQFIKSSFEVALGEKSILSRDKSEIGMELDIYIPSIKFAIEPGNWLLHKRFLKRDEKKRIKCEEKGIRLITIYDKFPLAEQPPFEQNCFVFREDLNKADHSIIRNLVEELFKMASIEYIFDDQQWDSIEKKAYDNAKAKTHDDFVKAMNLLHPNLAVKEKYKNANKRLLVQCLTCGFEWNGVPASLLAGDGCRKCGTKVAHEKFVKPQHVFKQQVQEVNPNIEILGEYTGRHSPIQAKCRICGYIWNPIAASLLRGSSHKGWRTLHNKFRDKERDDV